MSTKTHFTTVPIRCEVCGQQTHKTLDAIRQSGGLVCDCGAFIALDVDAFEKEIQKSESSIKDFGGNG